MTGDPYLYPDSQVLRNKLYITDADQLERVERRLVTLRIVEGAPCGNFDLLHLQAIHHHLFQDVYDWAGEIRTLEIAKGGNQFQFHRYIAIGMADVHRRIVEGNYLRKLVARDFAASAAQIIGDVNYVHPFRDGNGRTQLQYLKQLAAQAGHALDLTQLRSKEWLRASQEAHNARYEPMAAVIKKALIESM